MSFLAKLTAAIERNNRCALHELCNPRSRVLDQIFDGLAERRMRFEPTNAPARHGPVLRKGIDEQDAVRVVHDVEE